MKLLFVMNFYFFLSRPLLLPSAFHAHPRLILISTAIHPNLEIKYEKLKEQEASLVEATLMEGREVKMINGN